MRLSGPDKHSDNVILACYLPFHLSATANTSLDEFGCYSVQAELSDRVHKVVQLCSLLTA